MEKNSRMELLRTLLSAAETMKLPFSFSVWPTYDARGWKLSSWVLTEIEEETRSPAPMTVSGSAG